MLNLVSLYKNKLGFVRKTRKILEVLRQCLQYQFLWSAV